jgi:hypothetical protein
MVPTIIMSTQNNPERQSRVERNLKVIQQGDDGADAQNLDASASCHTHRKPSYMAKSLVQKT